MKKVLYLMAIIVAVLVFGGCAQEYDLTANGIDEDGLYINEAVGFTYEFPMGSHLYSREKLELLETDDIKYDFGYVMASGSEVFLKTETMPIAAFPTDIYADMLIDTLRVSIKDKEPAESLEGVTPIDRVYYGGVHFDRLDFTLVKESKDGSVAEKEYHVILLKSVGDKMLSLEFVSEEDKSDFDTVAEGFAEYEPKEEE